MGFLSSTVSIGNNTKKSDYDLVLNNTKALKDENITLNGEKIFVDPATLFDSVRRITSANYLHETSTENDIFDKLNSFIPTVGNIMKIGGVLSIGGTAIHVNHVERTSSTEMTFRGLSGSATLRETVITNGDGTATVTALSW